MRPSLLLRLTLLTASAPALALEAPTQGAAVEVSPCAIPLPQGSTDTARNLVRLACNEHRLWHAPFIDRQGRAALLPVTEAESSMLADDGLRAWQRVASYWTGSNTLARTTSHPGSSACLEAAGHGIDNPVQAALCRSFLLDMPWSAAFISWLMGQAGVSDFPASAAHLDYIAASHRLQGPYRISDPHQTRIRPGDLLCHLRGSVAQVDHAGLLQALAQGRTHGWQSHCDLVIASNPGGNRTAYLIGGNVLNAVSMRLLEVNERGSLPAPAATTTPPACSVQSPQSCSLNPPRWVALLQLQTSATPPLAQPPVKP